MAGIKVFARRAMIVVAACGFVGVTLTATHEAAGAAVRLGSFALPR